MKRSDVVNGQRYRIQPYYQRSEELPVGTVVEVLRPERGPGIQVVRVADIVSNPESVTVYRVAAAALEPIEVNSSP